MNILTFDTSLDKTYVSLSFDGEMLVSEVIENHNEKYHSAFLIPTIVSILKKYNITMKDIDVIGTNIGPGSFTGIRACVTVARVFAQQLNIPLVGISSLEILSKINNTNSKTEKNINLIDKLSTDKDEEEILTNKMVINELINNLNKRERKVILLRYFKGKTQKEVAKIIGVTQVQVSRIERKVLDSMKTKLCS